MDAAFRPNLPSGHTTFSWGRPPVYASSSNSGSVEKQSEKVTDAEAKREVRLPQEGKRNILITSALPYVNNVPHLGNLIGCVLSADVYSRFCRNRGHNSVYVCGTDEYGTATERKAIQAKMTPRQICDKYHAIHKEVYDWFNIDFDVFGRTTGPNQTPIAQEIFNLCDDNKRISSKTVQQLYCAQCDQFLADRYIQGTCPNCASENALGDQCDDCGQTYEANTLVNPKCTLCQNTPTERSSNHLFLTLDDLTPQLRAFIDQSAEAGGWSDNSKRITEGWLGEGLQPRCITRDLKWGTPVPKEGYTDKVFYVWFDAPIGYISITAAYTPEWRQWWLNPENVELVQFMGKDNVPFHTVMFPSTLLGTGQPWTLLHRISTTEYLNYENGKFSKSRNTGVFGDNAKTTGIPVAVFRYYLLGNRPEASDTIFKWTDLAAKNNNELLKNLGNFVNRSLSFVHKYFGGCVPAAGDLTDTDTKFLEDVSLIVGRYIDALEVCSIKAGLQFVMEVSRVGNGYFQSRQPWKLMKNEDKKAEGSTVIALGVSLVHLLGVLVEPYMPSTSANIFQQLNLPFPAHYLATEQTTADEKHTFAFHHGAVPAEHKINPVALLFTAIGEEKVEECKKMFGGEEYAKSLERGTPFALSLRVGEVMSAELHPTAGQRNFVLQVKMVEGDVPEEEKKEAVEEKEEKKQKKQNKGSRKRGKKEIAPLALPPLRQIVSGLVGQYSAEDLVGKKVVVVCNAAPVNLQGVDSNGMILTVIAKVEGKKVFRLLTVDKPNGSEVLPEGHDYEHKGLVNVKKTLKACKLRTGESGEATSNKVVMYADGATVVCEGALAKATIA